LRLSGCRVLQCCERLLFKLGATLPESGHPSKSVQPVAAMEMKGKALQTGGRKAEMSGELHWMGFTGMANVQPIIMKLAMPVSLMEQLAIPLSNQETIAKGLVISPSF